MGRQVNCQYGLQLALPVCRTFRPLCVHPPSVPRALPAASAAVFDPFQPERVKLKWVFRRWTAEVAFSNKEDFEEALDELDGYEIGGCYLRVERFLTKKQWRALKQQQWEDEQQEEEDQDGAPE